LARLAAGAEAMNETVDQLFPRHLHALGARMDRALAGAGFERVAIYSGRATYRFLDDITYPFKVNPHFKQWAPLLDAPESFIAYRPGRRPELHFFQPADYWHLPPQLPDAPWLAEFDVKVLREPVDARTTLDAGAARTVFIGEWQPEFADWGFAASNPDGLLAALHYQRAIKSDYEIECVRVASRMGARGHLAARDAFRAGASEYEVHFAYCKATGLTEVELPYENIIAFDTGGAILHNHQRSRERDVPRRSMLIDAGAEFRGYASDITRTYSDGDRGFEQLIAALDAAQQQICAAVTPGTDYRDVHLLAHRLVAGVLREIGVIRCDVETAVASGVSGVFLPHGIGHLLGLQVHDVAGLAKSERGGEIPRPPGHPYLRLTRVLEPGFVVTIEPGLYFIDMLLAAARADERGRHIDWNEVERWRPFGGIRIEDDVACTSSSPLNLTREAFAAIAAGH
jgi:Xaa-Pro dipeptidase